MVSGEGPAESRSPNRASGPTHVCIVGPDGAGKTTVATALGEHLAADGWAVVPMRARPETIDRFTNHDHDYRDPHRQPPRSAMRSTAKVLGKFVYAWVRDGRDRRLRRRTARRTLLLEERGWLDHGVDNRRYRIHPRAAALVLRLGRFVPRPDLTVVLTGDPAVIAERKSELSSTEVERQLQRWQSIADDTIDRDVIELDTTALSPEATVGAIRARLDGG